MKNHIVVSMNAEKFIKVSIYSKYKQVNQSANKYLGKLEI